MNQPLVEKPPNTAAERFEAMAARIRHNADAKFGGACVIIPPEGGGEPIEVLLLDSSGNIAQFWSAVVSRSQSTMEELKMTQDRLQGLRR